jgi:arylsulfatase A-like enzyme/Tfp pilus assembly protein PilF
LSLYSTKYARTPHIDKLGRSAFVFTRAFAHNPVTLPSHINILTGVTPLYHGVSDNTGFRLEERFLTSAEMLKAKGYATGAFIGAFPLDSRFGLDQGFDVYDDNYGTHSSLEIFFVERSAEKVIKPAREWISGRQGKWFSWVHLFDPHQPYFPPAPFDKEYRDDPYSGECAYVDKQVGSLLSFLEERKLLNKTIIIITGDHGEGLGEKGEKTHSYFAYNSTIHIPLVIYIPGGGSKTISEYVSHIDIFPTICDILGYEIPAHIQGESLLPVIAGGKKKNGIIYFESLSAYLNRGWAPLRGFIKDEIKYIDLPIKEVYDLKKDLDENKNLVSTADIGKLFRELEDLKKRLAGKSRTQRAEKLDPEVQRKLRSLGYVSGPTAAAKEVFTKEDDLKTLLPIQDKMLTAVGKFQDGQTTAAVDDLNDIVDDSPNFVLVYSRMADIYKEINQPEKAIDILRKGLKANPANLEILSKLGILLAESNQPKEAIAILTDCTIRESFNPEHFNYLGVAYYKSGDFEAALKNYREALKLDKNYASVFNNIGTLYLTTFLKNKDRASHEEAMRNFNEAIAIDPLLFSAYNGRGAAYIYSGETGKAIADWQKAIEIKPDFTDPYFSIGITSLKIGDKDRALKIFLLLQERYYTTLSPPDQQRLLRLIAEAR